MTFMFDSGVMQKTDLESVKIFILYNNLINLSLRTYCKLLLYSYGDLILLFSANKNLFKQFSIKNIKYSNL